jgi:hypothetical protein
MLYLNLLQQWVWSVNYSLQKKQLVTVKITKYLLLSINVFLFFRRKELFVTIPSVLSSSRCLLLALALFTDIQHSVFFSGIGYGWKYILQTARLRNLMYKILLQNLEQFPRSERHSKVSH